MKKVSIILGLIALTALMSCEKKLVEDQGNQTTTPVESSSQVDLSGSVVIEIKNSHHLAGKTLNFDVTIEKITKGTGTQADTVEAGDAIEVHYTGTLEDGTKFDSSYDRDATLPFTVGAGQMIAGFDAGVVGMKLEESKTLTLAPADAYGEATMRETIPKANLADFANNGYKLEVGEVLPTQIGEITIVEVVE